MKKIILMLLSAMILSGCIHPPTPIDFSKFESVKPSSILILPVINESVEITAQDYLLSTLTVPLAELGYYVFPVNLVKRTLEDNGLSDANLVHSAPPEKICNLFGSDSVLYVKITEWNAQYLVLTTTVNVGLDYSIKDCKTGDTLWKHTQQMQYSPQNASSGNPFVDLIVMAIVAAMEKASPNYMPLARQANAISFYGNSIATYNKGFSLPLGPYALTEIKQ